MLTTALRMVRSIALLGSCLALFNGYARATTLTEIDWRTPGSACVPSDGRTTEWNWGQFGINRSCTTCAGSAFVVCPMSSLFTGPSGGSVQTIFADVYDRNSAADVACTFEFLNLDGSVAFSQSKSSTGNQASVQLLQFNPGIISEFDFRNVIMVCSVPAATASGVSHVTSIEAITTAP